MPELVVLYLRNIGLGVCLGVVFTALMIGFDVAHLRHLVLASPGGWIAVGMLLFFSSLLFSGVQFAIAVMRMAGPENSGGGGLKAHRRSAAAPITVPIRTTRRQ